MACYGIGKYDDDDAKHPGSLFIVQELVRGGNLLHMVYKQMLNQQRCVYTSEEALEWLIDVAAGMQYLHFTDHTKPMIIHRDLKLENIMLENTGGGVSVAKLVDFGLHKVIDDRIQKVVKRVVSEANIGGGFGRNRVELEEDEDDELTVALAQQREAAEGKSASQPQAGPSGMGHLTPSRFSRLRDTSKGQLVTPMEKEEEEEGEPSPPAKSPLSRTDGQAASPSVCAHVEGRDNLGCGVGVAARAVWGGGPGGF